MWAALAPPGGTSNGNAMLGAAERQSARQQQTCLHLPHYAALLCTGSLQAWRRSGLRKLTSYFALHPLAGYSKKVKGKTAEERLDMRAAMKARRMLGAWSAGGLRMSCADMGKNVASMDA